MALTRRHFMISGAAALAAPGLALPGAAQGYQIALPDDLPQSPGTIITRVATSRPQVALTFDDGPHHSLTPALLDILAARGVRATFYVIGNRVARHAAIMQRIVAEGHEIGNHTWSHPSLYGYGDTAFLSEIDRTNQVIYDTVGRPPVTMRPPYGNITARQAALLYNTRNMATVLWSVDPQDWMRPGSSVVAQRIVNGSHPGAVVLSHDIHGPTVRAMPATIDGLAARGFECVTLSELMGWPRWDRRNLRLAGQS
jgi:peptidoglycan/xylan/chitin deacetylase (PgdA/CDA1 family)